MSRPSLERPLPLLAQASRLPITGGGGGDGGSGNGGGGGSSGGGLGGKVEGAGCAGQQDAHVGGHWLTVERFTSLSGAGVGVGTRRRRRRREGGGVDGGGCSGGSGGGAPTLLLALRVALLARFRRFFREVDVLAAEMGTARVFTPDEFEAAEPRRDAALALVVAVVLAAAALTAAVGVGVAILSRAARASASRRSKAATDRAACPVSV